MRNQRELWDEVDRLGEELANCGPEDDGVRRRLVNDIFQLVYEAVYKKDESDAIGTFFLKDWHKFDPTKGQRLSTFIKDRLAFRAKDNMHLDRGDRYISENPPETGKTKRRWRNSKADGRTEDGEEKSLVDGLPGRPGGDPYGVVLLDLMACELLAAMLELSQRLEGRANNPVRRHYYRLFFTDNVVSILHSVETPEGYVRRERDLFRAMSETFRDYFMLRPCRSVEEIQHTGLKPYGLLVEGRPMDQEPKQPLPEDVYVTYLDRVEHYQANTSAVSQQFTKYKKFVHQVLYNSNV